MKIAIMTDIEGVAGVLNAKDWIYPDSRYYEQAKILLTEEVNAAIRGLYDAGATQTVVIDAHGPGAVDASRLDKRALYSRGWNLHHQFGLNDGFDAIVWVGQHAKSGTIGSHLAHTGEFYILEYRLNGLFLGEYGMNAAVAGFYGAVPIFASGERALKKEIEEITPWVHTVEVKYGVTKDNGLNCDAKEYAGHNLGAVHIHHSVACERIYEGAKTALLDFIKNPEKFTRFYIEPPYLLETWIRAREEYPAHKIIRRHDSDIIGLFHTEYEICEDGTYELPYEYEKLD